MASVPNWEGGEVVPREALERKLDEMTLHDATDDPHDDGYMAAIAESRAWLTDGTTT